MQRAIITILFLLFTLAATAQTKGDTLYVAAQSGLNLRTEPGTKANKLVSIPKGGQIIILSSVDRNLAHSVTEFEGFNIKGFWVEVVYKGQVGYVFSGYLSQFKLNTATDHTDTIDYEYLLGSLAPIGEAQNLKYVEWCDTCLCSWTRYFNQGIKYTASNYCIEGTGTNATIEFSHHSMQDVYLFFNQVYGTLEGNDDTIFWDKEARSIEITPEGGGAGCYYSIFQKGKKVVLKYHCGC